MTKINKVNRYIIFHKINCKFSVCSEKNNICIFIYVLSLISQNLEIRNIFGISIFFFFNYYCLINIHTFLFLTNCNYIFKIKYSCFFKAEAKTDSNIKFVDVINNSEAYIRCSCPESAKKIAEENRWPQTNILKGEYLFNFYCII